MTQDERNATGTHHHTTRDDSHNPVTPYPIAIHFILGGGLLVGLIVIALIDKLL